ncbi:EAL domain-containing protein [Mesorhizobium sp. KR1-2]|uniref:EAL domain-containing protein n=1 Tax=Mesorhizobium sp. KR1-2 TaxID=3156609 RepID=UPI0032B53C48
MPSSSPFPEFTMAFQPIVDTAAGGTLFAYEALLRGRLGESAASVFANVPPEKTLAFDAACRERAVEMAASFGVCCGLSLNVWASAICDHRYGLHTTLRATQRAEWPARRLIFVMAEQEPVEDKGKLSRWIAAARNRGFTVAIDDFGAGYAGINSLLQPRPDMVKLDMGLVHGIDADRSRRTIVKGVVDACAVFGCRVVGEGVETEAEFAVLAWLGIDLMQGYIFARPGIACLPEIVRPAALTS